LLTTQPITQFCRVCDICSIERSAVSRRGKRLRRISTSSRHLSTYSIWTETASLSLRAWVGHVLFSRVRSLRKGRLLESRRTASFSAEAVRSRTSPVLLAGLRILIITYWLHNLTIILTVHGSNHKTLYWVATENIVTII